MFVKLTRSGPRQYVQLVESYRDERGRVKKRTVATLGRLDQLEGELDSVIQGLAKLTGRKALPERPAAPQVSFESARALGDVWALTELWNELGFGRLRELFRRSRRQMDVEMLLRVMVLNRLCDAESKLGVLRWCETVALPGVDSSAITHQQLLRSMDALLLQREAVDAQVATLLRPLIDQDLSVVFYDLTTIRAEGHSTMAEDVRAFGRSKEGLIARQFMLGVVQSAEGLPLYHEVFTGNAAETATLLPTLAKVLTRFPSIRRLIVVADRALLSLDNLQALQAMSLPGGHPLEFILAVPARRYGEFESVLDAFHAEQCAAASEEIIGELEWQGHRLVLAHSPTQAAQQTERRRNKLVELQARAQQWTDKLEQQDQGEKSTRGRPLSDGGATARFYHEVAQARLSKILRVDLGSALFNYTLNERALAQAERLDGKLVLVSNVKDLSAQDIVRRYKSLADIERGFRVLKSELALGPVYHRLPERIRAHAMICFLALILHRVMRSRLKQAHSGVSPEQALERLRRVQYHRIRLDASAPITGVSAITPGQSELFTALQVKKPVASKQLALL